MATGLSGLAGVRSMRPASLYQLNTQPVEAPAADAGNILSLIPTQ
jgi:hypothetical protein